MPGSATATIDDAATVIDSFDVASLPARSDPELRNSWRRLVADVRGMTYETDLEERHSRRPLERAVELALTSPDSMSISTAPVSRRHDMTSHVRGHFDDLLNSDSWGVSLKRPRPNVEYLLRACELAYLYDSVHRFNHETTVRPTLDGLEDVHFVELPDDLHRWMGGVDLLWLTLSGDLAAEAPLEESIDARYDERAEFVATAKDREIFLPIHSEYVADLPALETKIENRLSRNANVPPKLVHDYCFTRAIDEHE